MSKIKLPAQLLVAFAGSLIIAVYLWDRNGGLDVSPNPLNYQEDADDRVLHRFKRNSFSTRLQNIYQQFGKVDKCCQFPQFIPNNAEEACSYLIKGIVDKSQKQKKGSNKAQDTKYWFNKIKPYLTSTIQKKPAIKGEAQKNMFSFVCYMDCMFSYMQLLNMSAFNLDEVEKTFVTTATTSAESLGGGKSSADWGGLTRNALYDCEQNSACISPETVKVGKNYCSVKPVMLFNCMQKALCLNPAARVKNTYTCNTGMAQLRKTDLFKVPGN
ncbi:uncharacterized protein LOC132197762 [Neocloeon triangulifer]|uniref:uncharacterized protein LOC132197762 n=1 Tax=Neocloeon triangulifer TaxID=2078957 RepID=UPI00286EBC21|nr:uncharacterized protein LOC132197762 [Neocloeon triangulifer]